MIKLILTLPDGTLLPHELLESRITIGSGVECTLVVPHASVAETHVELLLDTTGYLVADLVGSGATLINGHQVEMGVHYQLETGTKIQMGEVEAVYIASEPLVGASQAAQSHSTHVSMAAGAVHDSGGVPGSYPLPQHPAGVFVPLKAQRSLWVMASVAVTFVAVAAALAVGYLSSTVSLQH